eukprot:TRINITY_DN3070_c0_g5_i1.p1 TRINITY_DN3070_c0_g5~~TRINITY_DN3070_c0_g5_i1.p1  ORF type:complete len:160 (-),score=49.40 TRINITY_DN3070_c0_g5_i1:315-761(-)
MRSVFLVVALCGCALGFYQCCLWKNTKYTTYTAVSCNTMSDCGSVTYWVVTNRTDAPTCGDCGKIFGLPAAATTPTPTPTYVPPAKPTANPVPCCMYSDPMSANTYPVLTVAVNPDYQGYCNYTQYQYTLAGHWYVASMYNECYFYTP